MDRKQAAKEVLSSFVSLRSKKTTNAMQKSGRGESMALYVLYHKPEGVTPGELREKMAVSSARITAILSALEAKGMVERKTDRNDRRRIWVLLTEEGLRRTQEEGARILRHVEGCLDVLEDEEIEACIRILEKLNRHFADPDMPE